VETDGQVVFNSNCNTSASVSLRGNMTITDNTAGMSSLTELAAINTSKINDEVLDVINVDTYTEPGQGDPGVNITLAEKINYLYKAWRNRTEQTTTELRLYADNGTTIDQKATVGDSGSADRGEMGTGA
jgi:spermidine/putrescine-binding protein